MALRSFVSGNTNSGWALWNELSAGNYKPGDFKFIGYGTVPNGFLMMDGSIQMIANYPSLYAAIGTTWGYGNNDGLSFNLPDFRGFGIRGWDDGAGNDPDSGSRYALHGGGQTGDNVGSYQVDALEQHYHYYGVFSQRAGGGFGVDQGGNFGTTFITDTIYGATAGSDTRMKNGNALFAIKY